VVAALTIDAILGGRLITIRCSSRRPRGHRQWPARRAQSRQVSTSCDCGAVLSRRQRLIPGRTSRLARGPSGFRCFVADSCAGQAALLAGSCDTIVGTHARFLDAARRHVRRERRRSDAFLRKMSGRVVSRAQCGLAQRRRLSTVGRLTG